MNYKPVLNWVHVSEVAEKDDTPTLRSGISHHIPYYPILKTTRQGEDPREERSHVVCHIKIVGVYNEGIGGTDLCDAK